MAGANHNAEILAEAVEVAHRYNRLLDRHGSRQPATDDELLELARALHQSCGSLGASKAYEMSDHVHDQEARLNHVVSLLPPTQRPRWYGIGPPPTPQRLQQARERLARLHG